MRLGGNTLGSSNLPSSAVPDRYSAKLAGYLFPFCLDPARQQEAGADERYVGRPSTNRMP
jgi:hypothetical protein